MEFYFGWIFIGFVDSYLKYILVMLIMVENNEVIVSLRWFWELEFIGIIEVVNLVML